MRWIHANSIIINIIIIMLQFDGIDDIVFKWASQEIGRNDYCKPRYNTSVSKNHGGQMSGVGSECETEWDIWKWSMIKKCFVPSLIVNKVYNLHVLIAFEADDLTFIWKRCAITFLSCFIWNWTIRWQTEANSRNSVNKLRMKNQIEFLALVSFIGLV